VPQHPPEEAGVVDPDVVGVPAADLDARLGQEAGQRPLGPATPPPRQTVGSTFEFIRKKFVGSHSFLSWTSRS